MTESEASHVEEEKEKVSRHYDLNPEVFEYFLDDDMNYSCAYFEKGGESLNEAQRKKMDLIAEKINLGPEDELLDVGCGWGNALLYFGENYGCQVTGLTIAENQAEEIRKKAEARGLSDQLSVVVDHFLEASLPENSFDKIIFIGSIIHIEDRPGAAELTGKLLKEGGRVLVSETYLPHQDAFSNDRASRFIAEDVFGYGNLITAGQEIGCLEETGFEILDLENITDHYVRTIEIWLDRIRDRKEKIERAIPGESKKLRTYLTLARRALKRRTSLQQQILARKLSG